MIRVGVDLGGHTIEAGAVEGLTVTNRIRIDTPEARGQQDVVGAIAEAISHVCGKGACEFVGLGVPAMLSPNRQEIQVAPNFPGWSGFALGSAVQNRLRKLGTDCPVAMENDANVYAIGEGLCGAARGMTNYIVLTLGTGIGGGMVLGGKIHRGHYGMACEAGHMCVGGTVACGCGGCGHLETVSAADGIESRAAASGLPADFKTLWEIKDEASACLEPFLTALCGSIASIIHLLDPQAVIIGGGMSKAQGLIEEIRCRVLPLLATPFREHLDIRASEGGADNAIIGAAGLMEH